VTRPRPSPGAYRAVQHTIDGRSGNAMRLVTGAVLAAALAVGELTGIAPPASAAGSGTITVQLATPDGNAIRLAGVRDAAVGRQANVGLSTTVAKLPSSAAMNAACTAAPGTTVSPCRRSGAAQASATTVQA
jgi:hypothetical protein